jgi:hypothetical protein
MGTTLGRVLYISTGVAILLAIGILGVEYLGETRIDPVIKDYRAVQAGYLGEFEEDQEFLRRVPIFDTNPSPQKDAGPYLNPRVIWTPDQSGQEQFATRLAPELEEEILRYRNDWLRHHSRLLRNRQVDLSWFNELSKFDYWDLESNSPQGKLIDERIYASPEQIPIPDSIELITLAKLRLAVGADENKPLLALQQVRQLAQLLLTTESIHMYTLALGILDVERRGYQYFLDTEMMKEDDWEVIPRNITRRASRALWAARGYFHVWTDPNLLERIFLGPRTPVGFCAAINEAAPRELSLRPLLSHTLPFERNLDAPLKELDKVMDRAYHSCRLKYLTAMTEGGLLKREKGVPTFLTILPYSRKIFGLRIATLPFIGFEGYADPKQQHE